MKLFYREFGEGQPLIILHGLFGFSDNWQTHAKRLSSYYRVILVDLRNHGHSSWSDEFSYQLMVDDIYELVNDLGLTKFILMGHSMGGKAAMTFAQQHENMLDKLIVVDMGVKGYPPHHQHILAGINAVDLSKMKTRGEVDKILSEYIHSEGVKQFLLKNIYWKEKGVLAWRMNTKVLEAKMEEILAPLPFKEVFIPTLFIRGELSNYILEEDYGQLEEYFPDCTIKTIPDAGHWVHAEAPELFIDTVLEFCLQ